MSSDLPEVKPFRYVYIPADSTAAVSERLFNGSSEAELRHVLTRHFRSLLLSEDQKKHMSRHISEEAQRNADKQKRMSPSAEEPASASSSETNKIDQDALIDQYLEQNSFEIVPVVMPTRKSKFIGTSLYVDDCGQFKGLQQNSRASRIAQREVRGDAFLLSNHDDPALDVWERIDTGLKEYEELHMNPPKVQLDPNNAAQMAAMTQFRESESKKIEEEDIARANTAKMEGNARVGKSDWSGAVEAYSVAVELTTGRRDLLANEAEANALRISSLLNRSLCYAKLRRFAEAQDDALAVLAMDKSHVKALYRLAQAQIGLQEFDEARFTVKTFEESGGAADDVDALKHAVTTGAQALNARQKKMFSKMFA